MPILGYLNVLKPIFHAAKPATKYAARKAGILTLVLTLAGCVLAPQTIELHDEFDLSQQDLAQSRGALIRVLDQREQSGTWLGHRGGRNPEASPLLAEDAVKDTLTKRLQHSMEQLGFGREATTTAPIKLQLDIQAFDYRCNEGVVVNECGMEMDFMITVINQGTEFRKPYRLQETRGLVASPREDYNEQWLNEMLDRLWQHIFNDDELQQALGS